MRLADLTIRDLRFAFGQLLAAILFFFLIWKITAPFLPALSWAAILVYATWPLAGPMRRHWPPMLAAAGATLMLALIFILPVLFLSITLGTELHHVLADLSRLDAQTTLETNLHRIPWLHNLLMQIPAPWKAKLLPGALSPDFSAWAGRLGTVAGGIGRFGALLVLVLITAFFFYRHGELLLDQLHRFVGQVLGQRGDAYLQTVASTIRAVIYGILATAIAQGALAGVGYAVAGLSAPVLLAIITLLFSFIPFGTPLVWGAASIWLLVHGDIWAGVGLALWGALVVSWIDNLIRPWVISSAVRIPFLLVLFGVLGGILAFGFLGLFLGPVLLAILLAIWDEWLRPVPAKSQG
jgi:predicted PurR-regulated permease PerM